MADAEAIAAAQTSLASAQIAAASMAGEQFAEAAKNQEIADANRLAAEEIGEGKHEALQDTFDSSVESGIEAMPYGYGG